MRLCIIGDDLVAGAGDPRALGWVGRVVARTHFTQPPTVITLAVPGETTTQLSQRWESEIAIRSSSHEPVTLIVAIGGADVPAGISLARSRLNLANILDRARSLSLPTMVIGPPPLGGVDTANLISLDQALSETANRRQVPYVECLEPLIEHEQWFQDVVSSPVRSPHQLTLPGQAGYALMAYLVLNQGWFELVDGEPQQ